MAWSNMQKFFNPIWSTRSEVQFQIFFIEIIPDEKEKLTLWGMIITLFINTTHINILYFHVEASHIFYLSAS